jgi:hypothetical protein
MEANMTDNNTDSSPEYEGRRKSDRRQAQQPFEGPDRRKQERRSGEDRRTTPRS